MRDINFVSELRILWSCFKNGLKILWSVEMLWSIVGSFQLLWKNTKFKKIKTILLFLSFNSILPTSDIVTDILTAIELHNNEHIYWSFLTLFWMFLPFIFNFLLTTLSICKKKAGKKSDVCKMIMHFPFILPLTNTLLAIRLAMIDLNDPSNAKDIESIKKTAALAGLYESFLESGPQLLTQIHIYLCTGHISKTQIISIIVSILTLTLAACKAFYVQRQFSEADPDPNAHMLVIIFFLMLVNVMNGTAQWTIIAGLMKHFIVIPIIMVGLTTWISLRIYKRVRKNEKKQIDEPYPQQDNQSPGDEEDEEPMWQCCLVGCLICFGWPCACCCCKEFLTEETREVTRKLAEVPGKLSRETGNVTEKLARVTEDKEDDKGFFPLKSSLTSVWVTCVVGRHPQTLVISSLTSLATRTVFLILAILFSFLGVYPAFLQERAFLLHCSYKATLDKLDIHLGRNVTRCLSLASCFDHNDSNLQEFLRVCEEDEEDELPANISILAALITLLIVNLMSTYFLHRLSNYLTLYNVSKRSPIMAPIIHRNIIFKLIQDEDHVKLEEVVKFMQTKDASETDNPSSLNKKELSLLDRQNTAGESPLNVAVMRKDAKSVSYMCEAGALVIADSSRNHPVSIALENNDIACLTILAKSASTDSISKWCKPLIESDKLAAVRLVLDHHQSPILYTSNIVLGDNSGGSKVMQQFDLSGEGKKEMQAITINLRSGSYPVGLDVVWTDGSQDTVGLHKGHKEVKKSKELVAPQGGHFSFIRGRGDWGIHALAVDCVDSEGNTQRGEWVGNTGKANVYHTATTLDKEGSPVTCRLYGIRGQHVEMARDNSYPTKLVVTYLVAAKVTEGGQGDQVVSSKN